MSILQYAKRSVLTAVAVSFAAGCGGDSGPNATFSATGTSADVQAVSSTFESPTFNNFSSMSVLFDAALGGAPLISSSAAALDVRGATTAAGLRAAAVRSAQRLAKVLPASRNQTFSASSAAIPAQFIGKTFVYNTVDGTYIVSDLAGAPVAGVRFLLYAVDPLTLEPVQPLVTTGYVDITDKSAGITHAAQVVVVSGGTTYLDYTVSASSTASSGLVNAVGYVTDGTTRANFNLHSTLTLNSGLSLVYNLDVPSRDVSIDLTLAATGLDTQTGTLEVALTMQGPNGTITFAGQFTSDGGTITVKVSGDLFATITSTADQTVITGANGHVLTTEDSVALDHIFVLAGGAFGSFDQLLAPVGVFVSGGTT
jgi:hypothetical protein